ncbi:hypothetical protein CCACVL1_23628 [Corchorus capsularis]|uniref:Uncharacterized protein n=1 Tax=Corchorus capsularis TaxID=210143 RepID=A0A1R3GT26_COCAP|nr:hypothetical protein CCACVL1_23628 [Corchorus capsularis]
MGSLERPTGVLELLPTLNDACSLDDKDSLILMLSFMKKMFGESECWHPSLLHDIMFKIIKHDAVRCATALLEGEIGIKVDINTFFETHSKDHRSLFISVNLLELFLRHGARMNFGGDAPAEPPNHEILHPLNLRLRDFSSREWTPEQSIFRLIFLLCIKDEVSDGLEDLRSLVENGTKEVDKEIVNCVIEGKVMELAALILAAPQKVTTTKFSFDARSNRSMTIRQFLLEEISMLKATQTSFDYLHHDETDPLANHKDLFSSLKEKLAQRMSQLHLLEICERVGDITVTYLKEHQPGMDCDACKYNDQNDARVARHKEIAKDVVCLLQNAGFSLTFQDYDVVGMGVPTDSTLLQSLAKIRIKRGERWLDMYESDFYSSSPRYLKLPKKPFYERLGIFSSILASTVEDEKENGFLLEHKRQLTSLSLGQSFNRPCGTDKDLNFDYDRLKSALVEALENLCHLHYFQDWSPEKSIFKLVYILCIPELELVTIKKLASELDLEDVVLLACLYAKDGKLVEFAALLLGSAEKLKATSYEGDSDEIMAIRQYCISEMQSIIDEQTKLRFGHQSQKNGIEMCKQRERIISSALLLLDVFDLAAFHLDLYYRIIAYEDEIKVAEQVQFFALASRVQIEEGRYGFARYNLAKESKVGAVASGNQMNSLFSLCTRSFHTCRGEKSKFVGTQIGRIHKSWRFDNKWAVFAPAIKRGISRI